MSKTTIVETTERFDENGKLIERVVREETTENAETEQLRTKRSYPSLFDYYSYPPCCPSAHFE